MSCLKGIQVPQAGTLWNGGTIVKCTDTSLEGKRNRNLKLVLLPGMDGTGRLLEAFLSALGTVDSQVIPLPDFGPQDYDSLAKYIYLQLPNEPFDILAESFSGAVIIRLIAMGHDYLRKVVFVASFLSSPGRLRTKFASRLPFGTLSGLPLASFGVKWLCWSSDTNKADVVESLSIVREVPAGILKQRLQVMSDLSCEPARFDIPVLCLIAARDRLVKGRRQEFEKSFSNIVVQVIDGPHFLLQACTRECAQEVRTFLAH